MEICTYRPEHWPRVQAFINEHWRAGHPYTDRALYDWQFSGFGNGGQPVSRLVLRNGEVLGLLGGIPGDYFLDGTIRRGVVFDLWVVRPDVRHGALGLMLMRALEDEYPVSCCLGVNLNVVRFYTTRGYRHSPCLHRYLVPLSVEGVRRLLSRAGEPRDEDLEPLAAERAKALEGTAAEVQAAESVDGQLAEALYARTVEPRFRYGLHRSREFWEWRYLRSAGFRYLFFGDPGGRGLIVARVERVISPEHQDLNGLPVLRLIELLPGSGGAWEGALDDNFAALLRGVFRWAAGQGCVLADFQHSSDRLGPLLATAGFADVSMGGSILALIPNLFQPLRFNASPINFVWRTGQGDNGTAPQVRDTYFVKSDDGMDRPNIWPLPPGYASMEQPAC